MFNINGDMHQKHYCILCKNMCTLFCERCGDAYCSPACQQRDWPSHRYICFPMPPLVRNAQPAYLLPFPNGQANAIMLQQPNGPTVNVSPKQQPKPSAFNFQQQPQFQNKKRLEPEAADFPKPNSRVILMGFRSYNRCFVRAASQEAEDSYKQLMKSVKEYGEQAPLLNKVVVNSYAIGNYNGMLGRVHISSVMGNKARVHFIDFGFECTRDHKELRTITDELVQLKRHVELAHLRSAPKHLFQGQTPKFLEALKGKHYKIVYKEDKKPIVELYDCETDESLSQTITNYYQQPPTSAEEATVATVNDDKTIQVVNSTTIVESPPKTNVTAKEKPVTASTRSSRLLATKKAFNAEKTGPKPLFEPPFKFKSMPVGAKNVSVLVLDTYGLESGFFGCIPSEDRLALKKILDYFAKFKPSDQPYKPVKNEYVVGLYEDLWYRCKCTNVEGDRFTVLYIDFTNEEVLTSSQIRPYPLDLTIDCCSSLCVIDGLPDNELNENQAEFLVKWGFEVQAEISIDTVLREMDGALLVECNDLIEKMGAANLI